MVTSFLSMTRWMWKVARQWIGEGEGRGQFPQIPNDPCLHLYHLMLIEIIRHNANIENIFLPQTKSALLFSSTIERIQNRRDPSASQVK